MTVETIFWVGFKIQSVRAPRLTCQVIQDYVMLVCGECFTMVTEEELK